jgi:hypothetical protein
VGCKSLKNKVKWSEVSEVKRSEVKWSEMELSANRWFSKCLFVVFVVAGCIVYVLAVVVSFSVVFVCNTFLLYCCTTATGLKPNCSLTNIYIHIYIYIYHSSPTLIKYIVFLQQPEEDPGKFSVRPILQRYMYFTAPVTRDTSLKRYTWSISRKKNYFPSQIYNLLYSGLISKCVVG